MAFSVSVLTRMTNVDVEFIKDLDECLKIADQLSKLDTEEAKLFVSQQLNELHTFLQKKQRDVNKCFTF